MTQIHIETYKKVLEKFEPEDFDPEILETLIKNVACWYADKKRRGIELEVDEFHQRYKFEVNQISDILDLFTSKNYRSALGTYFGHRAALRRLGANENVDPYRIAPMSKLGILQGVDRDRASVQATHTVVIKFRATKPIGHLRFEEVETIRPYLYFGRKDEKVSKDVWHHSLKQALAAMNQRRKND